MFYAGLVSRGISRYQRKMGDLDASEKMRNKVSQLVYTFEKGNMQNSVHMNNRKSTWFAYSTRNMYMFSILNSSNYNATRHITEENLLVLLCLRQGAIGLRGRR